MKAARAPWLLFAPALAAALVFSLAGCRTPSSRAGADAPRDASSSASSQPTPDIAAPPPVRDASAAPKLRGGLVTPRSSTWAIDATAAAAPSATLPAGSIFVAATTTMAPTSEDAAVTIFEWDVAAERVLRTATLPGALGDARAVRLARTAARLFVAVETGSETPARVFVLRHDLSLVRSEPIGPGEWISIDASDRHVAVSTVEGTGTPSARLVVRLLEPETLREIGRREVGGIVTDATARTDHLELGHDRLFVAGTANRPGGPRRNAETGALSEPVTVFALALPSLEVRATYVTDLPGQLGASLVGDPRSRHLYVHTPGGNFIELDRNAGLVAKRAIAPGSLPVFSTRGELFDGGDEQARTALFTADDDGLEAPPHCAAVWSASARIVVCGLGAAGVRIARVAKDWPASRSEN